LIKREQCSLASSWAYARKGCTQRRKEKTQRRKVHKPVAPWRLRLCAFAWKRIGTKRRGLRHSRALSGRTGRADNREPPSQ